MLDAKRFGDLGLKSLVVSFVAELGYPLHSLHLIIQ